LIAFARLGGFASLREIALPGNGLFTQKAQGRKEKPQSKSADLG
jgi:hypothetical protein